MAEQSEQRQGITRRDFLGIATAGLGATVGGVGASLVTNAINQKVGEVASTTSEAAAKEGDRSSLGNDNVGFAEVEATSIADATATKVEIDPPAEKPRYSIVDSHLHYVDFIQRSDGFPALCEAMDASGVEQAVIFGLPMAKQWDEHTEKAPNYYLSNDCRCYYYSGTDAIVAEELLAQPKEIRERFFPFCCGINSVDRFAADHIRQLLRMYPKFWCGIGELMSHHDDLTALTYGEAPRLDHPAFLDIFDLGAEEGLPVLVHHNITAQINEEILYRDELERAVAHNENCKIIWAHMGISRRVEIKNLGQIVDEVLSAHPNLSVDISWVVYDYYMLDNFPDNYSAGESIDEWVALVEKHADRFLIGTDKVGHWKTYPAEVVKYYQLLDKLKPATVEKLCRTNVLGLVKRYDEE